MNVFFSKLFDFSISATNLIDNEILAYSLIFELQDQIFFSLAFFIFFENFRLKCLQQHQ